MECISLKDQIILLKELTPLKPQNPLKESTSVTQNPGFDNALAGVTRRGETWPVMLVNQQKQLAINSVQLIWFTSKLWDYWTYTWTFLRTQNQIFSEPLRVSENLPKNSNHRVPPESWYHQSTTHTAVHIPHCTTHKSTIHLHVSKVIDNISSPQARWPRPKKSVGFSCILRSSGPPYGPPTSMYLGVEVTLIGSLPVRRG